MSVDFKESDQVFSRILYRWHGIVSQPTYHIIEYFKRWGNPLTPHVYDNYSNKPRELAYRCFGPAALVGAAAFLMKKGLVLKAGLLTVGFAAALEVGRLALHCLARFGQKKNYIHVRGNAREVPTAHPKIMSWNILGFPAGLNYTTGGCIPFRKRFLAIAEHIRLENPDIAIFQECLMDASVTENIIDEFKNEYAHFFIHNGPAYLGLESGLVVMSKCPILDYTFTPFTTNDALKLTKGFATLKIPTHMGRPAFAVIGTHMEAGTSIEDVEKRKTQLAEIVAHAQHLTDVKTVILAGDTNINAAIKGPERAQLDQVLTQIHDTGLPTCTNQFRKLRDPQDDSDPLEWIDQISVIRRDVTPDLEVKDFKVIEVFKDKEGKPNSSVALSDHNAVVGTVQLKA